MIGAIKTMNESPDLRPALAYLKAVAAEDTEGIRMLTEHGDQLELIAGLADLVLLFVEDITDNPSQHSSSKSPRSPKRSAALSVRWSSRRSGWVFTSAKMGGPSSGEHC